VTANKELAPPLFISEAEATKAARCGNGAARDNGLPGLSGVPHSDGIAGSEQVGPKHRGGTAVEYFVASTYRWN
jgi:hypothetical protein